MTLFDAYLAVDWSASAKKALLFGTPRGLSGANLKRVEDEEGWIFGSGL